MAVTVNAVSIAILLVAMTVDFVACGPQLEVKPIDVTPGLSATLEVNCTFSFDGLSGMSALISLLLSRATDLQTSFQELGSINAYSNGKVSLLTSENITASGFFSPAGESYLYLRWDYPSDIQGGVYKCVSQGIDPTGHMVVMADTAQVTVHQPGVDDYNDRFKEMDMKMNTLMQIVSVMDNHTRRLEQEISVMEISMSQVDTDPNNCCQNITALNRYTEDLEQRVSRFENMRHNIMTREFEDPFTYKGHKYYISRTPYISNNASIGNCSMYWGYLAEIDNADEMGAISTFLKSLSGDIKSVVISGSDEVTEGTWLLPSGKPVPYLNWHSGEPHGGDNEQCLNLCFDGRTHTWWMCDLPCVVGPYSHVRYMCEIEEV